MPGRIAITGATGLIGGAVANALRRDGVDVVTIGRSATSSVRWDFARELPHVERERLEGIDGVIHLVGAPIAKRWTAEHRRAIVSSRVDTTTMLSRELASLQRPPRVLLSGSGVGAYGNRRNEILTEDSTTGEDFLSDLARAWEGATRPAEDVGVRVAHLRMGIVLSRTGGALGEMRLPFSLGIGGRLGSGRQWMSWIALSDVVRAMRFALERDLRGPVNFVSPNPVTNAEFTKVFAAALHRPAVIPVPVFALKALFGEMAEATLLASQRAVPARLIEAGFLFGETDVGAAIVNCVN